jgi:threonine/homoserine/homoserine lactone efflux protein
MILVKGGIKMNPLVVLYFAAILAGFALAHIPAVGFLAGLTTFFTIIGALAIIIFSVVLLYMALKALFNRA